MNPEISEGNDQSMEKGQEKDELLDAHARNLGERPGQAELLNLAMKSEKFRHLL